MSERSENASIYDLLVHEEEPPRKAARERTGAGWWVRTALIAAALTAVTVVALRLFAAGVAWPAVFAGFFALLSLRRVTAVVAPPPPPRANTHRSHGTDEGLYHWGGQDALRGAVKRWERMLAGAQNDGVRFARTVLPPLGELVDERLRQRHGLTRASDPARARALMGDPLWQFLANPAKRGPAPRDLAAIVAKLESL
jgi:hypothetical protein